MHAYVYMYACMYTWDFLRWERLYNPMENQVTHQSVLDDFKFKLILVNASDTHFKE